MLLGTVWNQTAARVYQSHHAGLAAVAFINKMDRMGADFQNAISSMKHKLNANVVPIQFPLGSEETFVGVIDLISMNKLVWSTQSSSRMPLAPVVVPLTPETDMEEGSYTELMEMRDSMFSSLAENDEEFMGLYLQSLELQDSSDIDTYPFSDIPQDCVIDAIARLCRDCVIVPVLCGASLRGKGVESLLDAISSFLPPPTHYHTSKHTGTNKPRYEYNLVHKHIPTMTKHIIPSTDEDLCGMVFKVVHDSNRGFLSFVRIFSGKLSNKMQIYNSTRDVRERVNQLCRIQADDLELLDVVYAGDVGCIIGLKHTATGDTIVNIPENSKRSKSGKSNPLTEYVLDGLSIPEPVFALSIEPEKASQQPELERILGILSTEDPSLRIEVDAEGSGITMLKGLGELHLEIVLDKLRRSHKMEVSTGKAHVQYKETIGGFDTLRESFVYDKQLGNKLLYAMIEFEVISVGVDDDDVTPKWSIAEECKKTLGNISAGTSAADYQNAITEAFQVAYIRGPHGYPITAVDIRVLNIEKHADCTPGGVRACIALFIEKLFRSSEYHILLEPLMSLEVQCPQRFTGDVLNDLCTLRRATVRDVSTVGGGNETVHNGANLNTDNAVNSIVGEVPLETMLGYATHIRSLTQGEGSFSLTYQRHAP